jgi:hypothetical protein
VLVAAGLVLLAFLGGLGAGALVRERAVVPPVAPIDSPVSPDVLPANGPDASFPVPAPVEAPRAAPSEVRRRVPQSRRAVTRTVRAPSVAAPDDR